jgi:hypothetical protein
MDVTMVIPTYWARESTIGWQEGDAVYDHPTPLDHEGTLLRALQSMEVLADKDFRLVILAIATAEAIEGEVEAKVARIIQSAGAAGIETFLFGPSQLKQIHELLRSQGEGQYCELLQLRGYSPVRNLCLFVAHCLGSEAAVLIDDDEVFEDSRFIAKATEFIGQAIGGQAVAAVAGYYLQPDGEYRLNKPFLPWMEYWDQVARMNEGFDRFISAEPRMKETPFVFGGNMVVHRSLFTVVPFDPFVPRGEDIDFLINAKMFGFHFFLDNQLSIKHLPPPKSHPFWRQLREDIFRFVFEREKIACQQEREGMRRVAPEEFDPYPGCFLKADLEDKIERACTLLAEECESNGDAQGSQEALNNIVLAKTEARPRFDPFANLCRMQERWQGLMAYVGEADIASLIQDIIVGNAGD